MYLICVKKTTGWEVVKDTNNDIRTATDANDLLNEFTPKYSLDQIKIAEVLSISHEGIVITGGSNSALVDLITNRREESV